MLDADRDGGTPLLRMSGVVKHFGGVTALRDGALTIHRPGEAHALIGTNGSGKSTLLSVLSGQLRADAGTIELDGIKVRLNHERAALEHGIVTVSQETSVAGDLTVAENLLLGHRQVRRAGLIDWRASRERAVGVIERVGLELDPDALVRTLSPDQQQLVEICRSLTMEARLLILDEPTSSLSDDQVDTLWRTLGELREQQVSILLVSHHFEEIFGLCQAVTVLRDGERVFESAVAETTPSVLLSAMTGNRQEIATVAAGRAQITTQDVGLSVEGLVLQPGGPAIDLHVGRGEIVGLAGLTGCRRSEVLSALFGAREAETATVHVGARTVSSCQPHTMIAHKVGYLPPDRKVQGLVLQQSIATNLGMVRTLHRSRLSAPRSSDVAASRVLAERLRLRYGRLEDPVSSLSGGNQQKVAIGKWLAAGVEVLLLDEPTRGVDVAAKLEIHQLLRELAADGMSILVSSTESDELIALTHRILVMNRGNVTHDLNTSRQTTETLASAMGGHA